MAAEPLPRSLLTMRSILVCFVCIVAANLSLELLRRFVDLPFSDSMKSMLAAGVGVVVWFAIILGTKKVSDAR